VGSAIRVCLRIVPRQYNRGSTVRVPGQPGSLPGTHEPGRVNETREGEGHRSRRREAVAVERPCPRRRDEQGMPAPA